MKSTLVTISVISFILMLLTAETLGVVFFMSFTAFGFSSYKLIEYGKSVQRSNSRKHC